jgi:hypothetical protein
VVVVDVRDDSEAARIDLPGVGARVSGWPSPPVGLSGDHVHVGLDAETLDVDWRTGKIAPSNIDSGGIPDVSGGRATVTGQDEVWVVDATTGEQLRTIVLPGGYGWVTLSPDGRCAQGTVEETSDGQPVEARAIAVHTVDSEANVTIPGDPYGFGWTPDGHLFRLDGDQLVTCSPATWACEKHPLGFEVVDPNAVPGQAMTCTLPSPHEDHLEQVDCQPAGDQP